MPWYTGTKHLTGKINARTNKRKDVNFPDKLVDAVNKLQKKQNQQLKLKEKKLMKKQKLLEKKEEQLNKRRANKAQTDLRAADKLKRARRKLTLVLNARDKFDRRQANKARVRSTSRKSSKKKETSCLFTLLEKYLTPRGYPKKGYQNTKLCCMSLGDPRHRQDSCAWRGTYVRSNSYNSSGCVRANSCFAALFQRPDCGAGRVNSLGMDAYRNCRGWVVRPCDLRPRSLFDSGCGDFSSLRSPPRCWSPCGGPLPPGVCVQDVCRSLGTGVLYTLACLFWTPCLLCVVLAKCCFCCCCSDC